MEAVLSQLAAIAKERREHKSLPLHAVSRETTVGDDAVRKFESGKQGQNIDRMANAYADALGISVFDLWDEAIDRAKKADPADFLPTASAEALGSDEEDAASAAQAAKDAARASTKGAGKSPGKRSPKAKKGQAG